MADNLVICRRCNSDACYEVNHNTSMHWQCLDCGFYTSTFMLKNSELVEHLKGTLPDLYKDLLFEDADEFIWAPKTLNASEGTIFIDGSSKENWSWCFVPNISIPQDEQYRFPKKGIHGEFHTTRADISLKKNYGQHDFIIALQDSGMLNLFMQ